MNFSDILGGNIMLGRMPNTIAIEDPMTAARKRHGLSLDRYIKGTMSFYKLEGADHDPIYSYRVHDANGRRIDMHGNVVGGPGELVDTMDVEFDRTYSSESMLFCEPTNCQEFLDGCTHFENQAAEQATATDADNPRFDES